VAGDNGVHAFNLGATLVSLNDQSITATDTVTSSIAGSATIHVVTATHFTVGVPSSTVAGTSISLTVTALDQDNNIATGYRGTVHFTSSDLAATLNSNYGFVDSDNGVHTF